MKTPATTIAVFAVFVALIQVGGWAQEKYVPKDNEELYGTWINEKMSVSKIVVFPGGYREYLNVYDFEPARDITLEFASKWKDADGNVWFKAFGAITGGFNEGVKFQEIYKISESGTKWELAFNVVADFGPDQYPTRIDPKKSSYGGFFYRAGN